MKVGYQAVFDDGFADALLAPDVSVTIEVRPREEAVLSREKLLELLEIIQDIPLDGTETE